MMLVAGYSGIGKSVLVKEIYKSLTEKNGYFIAGKFDQFQKNIPYTAIVKAFGELVRQLLTESEAQLTKWKEQLLTALGPNGQVIIDVIPEIELIIGAQPPIPTLGPTESQNRFNFVFQNFMRVFCQPAHPLVIFLDDLQWVDSASLKLVERVMTDKETSSLFLIGAYRDNEVNPAHPLMMTLDNITINQITLKPLAFEHIQQLIADSLHSDVVGSLTDLVMRKTQGNPFFVNQFLHTLYEENLLSFIPPSWQWNLAQIEAIDITDNVVDLMIGKLKKLPESAQHVLRLAACIGNHFDLDTLTVIHEKSASETFQNLTPLMMEGLILPTTDLEISGDDFKIRHFQFLHDRVQQAAYALIDDQHKKTVHLKIGRLLLANTPAQGRTEKLFEIVDQLNIGIELIQASSEREQLAQLNLAAGIKAKSSTAYNAALNYLNNGIGLLKKDSWQQAYELTLKLHLEAAEAAYLNGQFDDMEQSANLVLEQKAATLLDKIKIYEVKIQAYMAQNRMFDAIETARFALKLLGIKIPQNPSTLQILFSLLKTRLYLATKRIENLIDQPEVSEPMNSAAMRILLYSISSAYLAFPKLLPILISKQIDLSLKYGHFPVSAGAYGAYGIILCGVLGDIKTADKLAQLALELLEKSPTQVIQGKTLFYINALVKHWTQHLKHSLNPLQDAYQRCLETGDLEYASYALAIYCGNAFYMGRELTLLEPEVASYNESMQALKQTTPLHYNQIIHQSIFNLMAENESCRLVVTLTMKKKCCLITLKRGIEGPFFFYLFKRQFSVIYFTII
jgi:predicted ATPase